MDSSRVSRAPPYSGTCFESGSISPTRLSRSLDPLSRGLQLATRLVTLLLQALQPPNYRNSTGLGCSDFARHYYRNRGFFLLLEVLRWFTSLRSLVPTYVFSRTYHGFCHGGFPHSEISGSTPVCGSPKLIAACHVLHRLFLPRHPPCALSSLTIEFTRTQQRNYLCNIRAIYVLI